MNKLRYDVEDAPTLPDGLPRRGMSTVAAVSSVLIHENHRTDGAWKQTYRYGIPETALVEIKPTKYTGTTVTFRYERVVSDISATNLQRILSLQQIVDSQLDDLRQGLGVKQHQAPGGAFLHASGV